METRARQNRWHRLGNAIFLLVVVNFAVFWLVSMKLGGDALNGKSENGRYYLMAKGTHTEVSRGVWIYSMIHTISIIAGFPLACVGVYLTMKSESPKPGDTESK